MIAFLLFLSAKKPSVLHALGMGLLIGTAAMIQTNYWFMAFPFALMQCTWFWPLSRMNIVKMILYGALLGAASAIPFLSFWGLYAFYDHAERVLAQRRHRRNRPCQYQHRPKPGLLSNMLSAVTNSASPCISGCTAVGINVSLPYALFIFSLMCWFTPLFMRCRRKYKILLGMFVAGSLCAA